MEIIIPRPTKNCRQKFLKFTLRKPLDFAVVSVASIMNVEDNVCKDARITLGAVAPTPLRVHSAEDVIRGRSVDMKAAENAANQAIEGFKPISMNAYEPSPQQAAGYRVGFTTLRR